MGSIRPHIKCFSFNDSLLFKPQVRRPFYNDGGTINFAQTLSTTKTDNSSFKFLYFLGICQELIFFDKMCVALGFLQDSVMLITHFGGRLPDRYVALFVSCCCSIVCLFRIFLPFSDTIFLGFWSFLYNFGHLRPPYFLCG